MTAEMHDLVTRQRAAVTPPIAALDVPLDVVKQQIARQRETAGLAAEFRHLFDPLDATWQQMACDHPDTCTCTPEEKL